MHHILPPHGNSYWISSTDEPAYPNLHNDLKVDVAIIGGGITGLTAAYLLKQAGKTVAVLEKSTIAGPRSVTGHSTGKVTSQHNLIYTKLEKQHGSKIARNYGEANQEALEQIAEIVKNENIDCDFEREDNYIYTKDPKQIKTFEEEAETAKRLGLPAHFETDTDLPFPVKAAVRFSDQAKIHPRKYTLALAEKVHGDGSYVFENTKAITVDDGSPCKIKTKAGSVTAKDVIIATSVPAFLPLAARILYGLSEYPMQAYIVAGRIDKKISGMYISPDKSGYSILPITVHSEDWLLIAGAGNFPLLGGKEEDHYQPLEKFAKKHFGDLGLKSISYRWTAMDYIGYDNRPLIGKLYPWSKHVYIVTGLKKWGLTGGTIGAMILSDTILGKKNPSYSTFDSIRLKPLLSLPGLIMRKLLGK